jgi:hypothetical protein
MLLRDRAAPALRGRQAPALAMILFKSRWNNAMPVVAPADTLCSRIVRRRELPN